MISLKTVRCLTCNTEYESQYLKFRLQLFTHTYEKCPTCGKMTLHKIIFKKNKENLPQPNNVSAKNVYIALGLIIMALLVVIILPYFQNNETNITFGKESLEIKGSYGVQIKYNNIYRVDTLTRLPIIELRTNGFSFKNYRKGNFKLSIIGDAKLFVNTAVPLFVQLTLKDKEIIFINMKDYLSTEELYSNLKSKIVI
jgi:Bacterial PH domain